MAISREQIIDAAEQLAGEGINPSMQAVRERLGGGSFATISPVLREWKEKREATTVAVLEMPSDIKGALERFGADLWKAASALATAQFEKLKEESRFSIEAANKERDEALAEIERLEVDLLAKDELVSSAKGELTQLQGVADEERRKVAALQQRNDDLQETIAGLRDDLKESKAEARGTLDKLDQLRQAQAELSRVNGELSATVEAGHRELKEVTEQRNEFKSEIARLTKVVSELETEKEKAVTNSQVLKTENATLQSEVRQLSNQVKTLEEQVAQNRKVIDSLTTKSRQKATPGSKQAGASKSATKSDKKENE
ncbi:DNA-binding protein [Rheinheimera sp. WS51]|uniref:DNA-binding protein n=1 Tax=Rheinheimera sp. WS51 TaxID=3425886 RepID=UPI003D932140